MEAGGAEGVELRAHSRIHIGLADMSLTTPRRGGGVGFSIEKPATVLTVNAAPSGVANLEGFDSLDSRTFVDIAIIVDRIKSITATRGGFRARLISAPPQHVGFGTKTALALALITGVDAVLDLGLSREDIQKISGRGGLSGIGIHAFFEGGVIWDGGRMHRKVESTEAKLLPSGAGAPDHLPPLMLRFPFPNNWRIALARDLSARTFSGSDEIEFFRKSTPVPCHEALESMALLYHGVLPSLRTNDLEGLGMALCEFHQTGFKARELAASSRVTRKLIDEMHSRAIEMAVGLSSLGPTVFAIFESSSGKEAMKIFSEAASRFGASIVGITQGWNSGYIMKKENGSYDNR